MHALLRLAEGLEEKFVVGNGLLDQLLDQEEFRAIDDGVDALLKGLHRSEGLEGITDQNYGGIAPLGHRHPLHCLKREILANVVGCKSLLDDDDLITNLAEANQKIAVCGCRVHFVAEFAEG